MISDDFIKIHLHQHQLYSVMHQMLRMHFYVLLYRSCSKNVFFKYFFFSA